MILLIIGEVLHIVGLATPNWTTFSTYDGTFTLGLWKLCSTIGSCVEIPIDLKTDEMKVVDAFSIICALSGAGVLGLACFNLLARIQEKSESEPLRKFILKTGIFALVCVIISTCVYYVSIHQRFLNFNHLDVSKSIGFSFILSAVGGVVIGVGSVIFYVACLRHPSP
uniref:Claudin n=1 Tax=Biomphalaria glabrata TaxID=6526 RepID=A0A2C9M4B9_BIOGL